MTFRAYRITDDVGHAPCVFDSLKNLASVKNANFRQVSSDLLSLSNCGYFMRKLCNPEDYIFVIAGNNLGELAGKLIWAGKVDEIIPKERYFQRFNRDLKYNLDSRPDNYYEKNPEWVQHSNPFHNSESISSDAAINRVILSREFWYFGANAVCLPENLQSSSRQQLLDSLEAEEFIEYLRERFPLGANGVPAQIKSVRRRLYYFIKAHSHQ